MLSKLKAAWRALTVPEVPRWQTLNKQHYRELRAAYDAAQPRDDLWTLADFADADASLRPEIRRELRARARYEYSNNTIVSRVVNVWVDDVMGESGPVLDMTTNYDELNALIEADWQEWWDAGNLQAKLRTAILAETVDGESVDLKIQSTALRLDQPIGLDVLGFESDRLASPSLLDDHRSDYVDGVHLDDLRQPVAYDLLKAHPGHQYLDQAGLEFDYETFPAYRVLHCFRKTRKEQHRGATSLTPVLPLSGFHRKHCEATVQKESLRAAFAFIIKTLVPGGDDDDDDDLWQKIQLPNRAGLGLMLPDGMDITQFQSDSGASDLDVLNRVMYQAAAACYSMPLGRAMGHYTVSGYAGVRGELVPYVRRLGSSRKEVWIPLWLRPLFRDFLREWILQNRNEITRIVGSGDRPRWKHVFRWDSSELVVDPSREEEARKKRLATLKTTLEEECGVNNMEDRIKKLAGQLGMEPQEVTRRLYLSLWNQPTEEQSTASAAKQPNKDEDD